MTPNERTDEAGYSDWLTGRLGTVVPSIDRFLDLMAEARVDDPAWRADALAEVGSWRLADTLGGAPPVSAAAGPVHRRAEAAFGLLDRAGAAFRGAIEREDADRAGSAFGLLAEAEAAARRLFVEVARLAGARGGLG